MIQNPILVWPFLNTADSSCCRPGHGYPPNLFSLVHSQDSLGFLRLPGICFSSTPAWSIYIYIGRGFQLSNKYDFLLCSLICKMVEPFTGHYVFALGIARFLNFIQWTIRVSINLIPLNQHFPFLIFRPNWSVTTLCCISGSDCEYQGRYFYLWDSWVLWAPTVLICEAIQSFILYDFCYYYVRRWSL